jgi:hypothetical protein
VIEEVEVPLTGVTRIAIGIDDCQGAKRDHRRVDRSAAALSRRQAATTSNNPVPSR